MRSIGFLAAAGVMGLAILIHGTAAYASPSDRARIKAGGIPGRIIYQQRCASCHGAQGEGRPGWQQRDAQGEMPPPPHDASGHTWKHADAMLYRIVRDGWRDPFNKTERLTMPAFGQALSPEEIRAVVTYLKTLWTPEQRRFQREESRAQSFPQQK